MMLTVRRPHHLKVEEAGAWLQEQASDLLGIAGVRTVVVSRLGAAGGRWEGEFDWLLELELELELELDDGADPTSIVRDDVCASLLGDLRLLGMRPSLAVPREAWREER